MLRLSMNEGIPVLLFVINDTATAEIYTLSLHDALPICSLNQHVGKARLQRQAGDRATVRGDAVVGVERAEVGEPRARFGDSGRSEEHTSELQSRQYLVCRLLLEKKTTDSYTITLQSRSS